MEGGVEESEPAAQQSPLLGDSQATSGAGYGATDEAVNEDSTGNFVVGSSVDISTSQDNFHSDERPPATCTVHLPSYSDAIAERRGQRKGLGGSMFIDLRKLVFAIMCIPTPTQRPSQCQRNCSKYSLLFWLHCVIFFFFFSHCVLSDIFFPLNPWLFDHSDHW